MRILLLNDDLPMTALGGSGRVVAEAAQELSKRGHAVGIITAAHKDGTPFAMPGIEIMTVPSLPVRWAHWRSVFSKKRGREVLSFIDAFKPDVIHAHGVAWQIGYRWMDEIIRRGTPCFYTAHGMMIVSYGKVLGDESALWWNDLKKARWTYNPFRNAMIKSRLSKVTALLCVSHALKEYYEKVHGYRGNLKVLHNGIDTDFWTKQQSQTEARKKFGLPLDVPLGLLAGRLGYDKGLDLLLGIWPKVGSNAHLVLAGSVPPVSQDRVHILPQMNAEGMRTLYAAVDVNLVPSLCFDCFPTTSLESMSCETPAIVTDRGGGKEAIIEGSTSWVINPRNSDEVLARINECFAKRSEMPTVGKAAREHVQAHFSLSSHIDRLLEIYSAAM